MRDAIVVTLAVGPEYADLAAAFVPHLVRKGNAVLVMTDQPATFAGLNVELVPHVLDGTHVWHAKRHAVRAGLQRARTAYFVDGDHQLHAGWEDQVPLLPGLRPGLGSHKPPVLITRLVAHLAVGPQAAARAPAWLDRVAAHLGLLDWRDLPWWGDWIFTVTRDAEDDSGTWFKFLDAWDRFAIWRRDNPPPHPLIGSDNIAMAFAAAACGWIPEAQTAVRPFIQAFGHLAFGMRTGRDREIPELDKAAAAD